MNIFFWLVLWIIFLMKKKIDCDYILKCKWIIRLKEIKFCLFEIIFNEMYFVVYFFRLELKK